MIAICYTGDKRHNTTLTLENHKKLIDEISKVGECTVYWFTKDTKKRGVCPYDDNTPDLSVEGKYRRGQGGAVQTWDFMNSVGRVKENIVIRMRTDTWFHDTAINVIVDELKEIISGNSDIAFFGSDLINGNVGKEREKIFVDTQHITKIQDFVIIADKTKILSPSEVYEKIDQTHPKKRRSGNKIFRYCIPQGAKAYTILCKIYLIRAYYETEPDELSIFKDYLDSYGSPDAHEELRQAHRWLRKSL